MKSTCPNCLSPVDNHPENGCVLAALISCINDRGHTSKTKLRELHANCAVDVLWDDLGPVIDKLEGGFYSPE